MFYIIVLFFRVKILASAVDYIQQLHTLLAEHEVMCRQGGTGTAAVKQESMSVGTPREFLSPPSTPGQTQIPTSSSVLSAANTTTGPHLQHANRSLTPPKSMLSPPMMVGPLGSTPYHHHHPAMAHHGHHMPPNMGGSGWPHHPYPMPHSPMNVHSPLSPYTGVYSDTSSMASSGYYSSSPALSTPKPAAGYRDYYHHQSPRSNQSSHSPTGGSSYAGDHTTAVEVAPPLTQDPTPSSTFQEEDEDILNSIIQWEKY